MLEALLRSKFRLTPDEDAEATVELGAEGHQGREDPLTAAVFARLSYLPDGVAWALLADAVQPRAGAPWPAPPTALRWRFWPSLAPGPEGRNRRRVEPDVVAEGGDRVVLFEAKHRGSQSRHQWVEQLSAARQRWPGRQLALVAVGGLRPEDDAARVAALPEALRAPVFRLSWGGLRRAAARAHDQPGDPHHQRILRDLVRALVHWGHRPSRPLSGVAALAQAPPPQAVAAVAAWRPVGPPAAPFARLVAAARTLAPSSEALFSDWEPT